MEENCLFGKTALIVGGSGGIGAEISRELSKFCKKIFVHGKSDSSKISNLLGEIRKSCDAQKIIFDFENADFFSQKTPLFEIAQEIDILCVCFGPFLQKPLSKTTAEEWKKIALLNYALPGILISAALPSMIQKRFGRILLFGGTGTAHRSEFLTNAAYAGAKSALNVLVSSCAAAYAKSGISCNAILPGPTLTEYTAKIDGEMSKKMPQNRQVCAKKIAQSAVFLLSSSEINGAILRIDQGWSSLANETFN